MAIHKPYCHIPITIWYGNMVYVLPYGVWLESLVAHISLSRTFSLRCTAASLSPNRNDKRRLVFRDPHVTVCNLTSLRQISCFGPYLPLNGVPAMRDALSNETVVYTLYAQQISNYTQTLYNNCWYAEGVLSHWVVAIATRSLGPIARYIKY